MLGLRRMKRDCTRVSKLGVYSLLFGAIFAGNAFAISYPSCRAQRIYDTAAGDKKGVYKTVVLPCNGKIKVLFGDDNGQVLLEKPNGQKQNLAICDNEAVNYFCPGGTATGYTGSCCDSSIPQHGAIVCSRDNAKIARLSANVTSETYGCPGTLKNYSIDVKVSDKLHIFNNDWASHNSWVEFTPSSQCQDGIDNDGDGATDHPADFSCSNKDDTDETLPKAQCQDGIDNDGDGLVDYDGCNLWENCPSWVKTDPGCSSQQDNFEGDGTSQCQDGRDNDNDGVTDAADPGCWRDTNNSATYDKTLDNELRATTQCQDRIDNDNDGNIDGADAGCSSPQDNNEGDEVGPPPAPKNLSASDGSSRDFVSITWDRAPNAVSYQLYRTQYSNEAGSALGGPVTGTSYEDRNAVPGVTYYYSVVAINSYGQSGLSNVDSGYRGYDGPRDSDGDGVSDDQERIDGTDPYDPGSFQLHLKSPAFSKYNTFLKQWNFLELVASGTRPVTATVSVYLLDGRQLAQTTVYIQPQTQADVDINSLIVNACRSGMCYGYSDIDLNGIIDTYGVVRIDFNNEAGATLMGRMSNYRQNPDGATYSFAFAKELRNPTRGASYAGANTFDPQASGFMVPNWLEIVNLNGKDHTFTYNLYNQQGSLVYSTRRTVPRLGEADIQAGHEIRTEGVYLAEVIPDDGAADYFATVSRYSSNALPGIEPTTYNFAFALEGRAGNGAPQFTTVSNQAGAAGVCFTQTNWLEVSNVRNVPVDAVVEFRNQYGAMIGLSSLTIAPKAQFHFNAGALIPKGEIGSAQVNSTVKGSLLSQSLVYYHDCGLNQIQTAFASQGRIPGRDVQAGSVNTNLGMENDIRVVSTSTQGGVVNAELRTFNGGGMVKSAQFGLSNKNSSQLSTSGASPLYTPPNSYGALTLRAAQPNLFMGEVLRVRNYGGRVDFAMPTVVQ